MSKKISKNKIVRRYFMAICADEEDFGYYGLPFELNEVNSLESTSLEFFAFDEKLGRMARIAIAIMENDKKTPVHWIRINLPRLYSILEAFYGLNIGKIMPDWIE